METIVSSLSPPCGVAGGSAAIGGFAGEASEEPSEPRSRGLRPSLTERIFFYSNFMQFYAICICFYLFLSVYSCFDLY